MPNLQQLNRVLVCHQWSSPEEWGRSIEALADLTDAEIADLLHSSAKQTADRSVDRLEQELLNRVTAIRAAAEILTYWEPAAADRQTFLFVILDEVAALSGLTEAMVGGAGRRIQ